MATTRWVGLLILGASSLALGATAATLAPRLELHWNKSSSTSVAVVKSSEGDVLAETNWGGALPRRYSADEEEAEVPVLALGRLRDQLYSSSQPEADAALDFIRELMDIHADTPVSQLVPTLGAWISYSDVNAEEWCGTAIDGDGECTAPGDALLQNALCTSFSCKKTTMSPLE